MLQRVFHCVFQCVLQRLIEPVNYAEMYTPADTLLVIYTVLSLCAVVYVAVRVAGRVAVMQQLVGPVVCRPAGCLSAICTVVSRRRGHVTKDLAGIFQI